MQLVPVLAILGGFIVIYYLFFKGASTTSLRMPGSRATGNVVDLGMYDSYNPNAFGTTSEADRRVTNYGVRAEYNKDPMPLGEGCGDCEKHGVPDPAMGHTHVCKGGPPSKRMVDANGGHFQLNHICAPTTGGNEEPLQLGRWWSRRGCSNPESVGLDIKPICTRCGI